VEVSALIPYKSNTVEGKIGLCHVKIHRPGSIYIYSSWELGLTSLLRLQHG
jgi:hypothetical protein